MYCRLLLAFSPFLKKRSQDTQNAQETSRDALKMAIYVPSWLQLGPSWRPSWAIGARFCSIRGWPKSTKRASKRMSMPRSPPDLDFHGFGGQFWSTFWWYVLTLSWRIRNTRVESAFGYIQVLRNTRHRTSVWLHWSNSDRICAYYTSIWIESGSSVGLQLLIWIHFGFNLQNSAWCCVDVGSIFAHVASLETSWGQVPLSNHSKKKQS